MDARREVAATGSQRVVQKERDNAKKQAMSRRMMAADAQGDINDMADAFIKKFRNQLKIQREESFKRLQEMLARGV
ncbi:hypothetical protein ACLB2K_021211 [Fragaria x ananassa]